MFKVLKKHGDHEEVIEKGIADHDVAIDLAVSKMNESVEANQKEVEFQVVPENIKNDAKKVKNNVV